MVNIFESAKEKVMPTWAKFVNAGDNAQGTYIGKILGQIDGYGNEQIIYQLLQDDGTVVNVGMGLNKKVFNADMGLVRFGQIVGIKYKGMVEIKDKRTGKLVNVKDFSIFQDPKIVDEKWLAENKDNMPVAQQTTSDSPVVPTGTYPAEEPVEDIPFSSGSSLTNADKLAVIEKLAKDKLGATDAKTAKTKVVEATGIALIPVNYDKITETLIGM